MTKVELFSEELQESASLFKALAHPARLAILNYLAETKVCISGDISVELPLSRTTVNQHLTVLKSLQFIKGNITGTKVNYCLNVKQIIKIKAILVKHLGILESCNDNNCE